MYSLYTQKLLAENKHLLKGKGKKRHDKLFNNILNGSFDMEDGLDELAQSNKFTSHSMSSLVFGPTELTHSQNARRRSTTVSRPSCRNNGRRTARRRPRTSARANSPACK